MTPNFFRILDLNSMDYIEALKLQEEIVSGKIKKEIKENIIMVLEHPQVFTLGKNGGRENIKVSKKYLASKKIPIIQTSRGGSITFHGPGQLVVYPIIDFNKMDIGITDFVDQLEEVMIQTSIDMGVEATRNKKNRGIWVKNRKLGSIGLCVKKGVSFHGFALNVSLDLEPFSWINPCGMERVSMTSLEQELRKKDCLARIKMTKIKSTIIHHFKESIKTDLGSFRFSSTSTLSETIDFFRHK
jgi:lipoate-protein ligase B